jgi:hypothetical protein
MHTFTPISWQWEPSGQSAVVVQNTSGLNEPAMQCRAPSMLGLLQPLQVLPQSAVASQTMAQLPLLRHSWPAGQGQATGCPQLFVRVPQRPAQVVAGGCGAQTQVLSWQT